MRSAEQSAGIGTRAFLQKRCWAVLWTHGMLSGDWISGSIQSHQSVWSREAEDLSSREGQGLGGSYCSNTALVIWGQAAGTVQEVLKSVALGFQIFVCCILYICQRTSLQYCVSTDSCIWHLCFPPWQWLIVFFWHSSPKGPKARVNGVNSQLTLDDIAERKSACVEHAYMVECVKAEKQAGMGEKRRLIEAEQRGERKSQ